MLQEFPFDCDQVFGNDAFIGRGGRECCRQRLMERLVAVGILTDDRIARGHKLLEGCESENFCIRTLGSFGHFESLVNLIQSIAWIALEIYEG